MTRTFIMLPEFDKNWANMGLNDDDLRYLQNGYLSKSQRNNIAKLINAIESILSKGE